MRTRRVLALAASALALIATTAVPGPAAAAQAVDVAVAKARSAACDRTGTGKNPCLRHAHVGDAADGTITTASNLRLKVQPHASLHGRATTGEVQVRRVSDTGKAGSWHPHGRFDLATVKKTHTITTCAPKYAGTYQARVVLRPSAKKKAATSKQARALPMDGSTSGVLGASAPTTVTVSQDAESCVNAPDDEELVEYYNEINFNALIEIIATSTGPATAVAWNIVISCPEPVNPDFPGPDFSLALIATDHSVSTSCADPQPITVDAAAPPPYCTAVTGALNCDFIVLFSNASSKSVYSFTETMLTLTFAPDGTGNDQTTIPDLEPATVPICNQTLNNCLLDSTCTLSTKDEGQLSLCESASSCTLPTYGGTTATVK